MKRSLALSVRDMVVFALLGAIMFYTKQIEVLPNIHPLAMLTVTYTVVYRRRGIIPVAVFILLQGVYAGFSIWWYPYLYLWPLLWAAALALPKKMSNKAAMIVYPLVCALHGLLYGTLYAPYQALVFGLDFKGTLAWIAAGFPYDAIHAASNLVMGLLVLPLSKLIARLDAHAYKD